MPLHILMKIAVPATGKHVSGPGEASEILIFDSGKDYEITERYENPALIAKSARGISMLQSVVQHGAETVIVAHIGSHAFNFIRGRLTLYSGVGMTVDEAIAAFRDGKLQKVSEELMPDEGHKDHNH